MKCLYCGDCSNYLMGGDGECHDCHCGWKQPEDQEDDHYTCDRCGDEYYFSNAYDQHINAYGEMVYLINGWYGNCDGQMMCDRCWDSY